MQGIFAHTVRSQFLKNMSIFLSYGKNLHYTVIGTFLYNNKFMLHIIQFYFWF